MKKLKKINKGLILTILVLLVLTIYSINIEKQRKQDKTYIKEVCEEYIKTIDEALVLPEEMQDLKIEISKNKKDEYEKVVKDNLRKVMIDNDEVIQLTYDRLEDTIYNSESRITKSERKISKISSYEFDSNKVEVNLNAVVNTTTKYLNGNDEEESKTDSFVSNNDIIELQKIDGKWKVTYSNLQGIDWGMLKDTIEFAR